MKAIWKARLFRILREIAGRVNLPCIFLLTAVEFSKAIESNESSGCVGMPWVGPHVLDCLWPAFARHFECRHHEFIVAAIAAKGFDKFGTGEIGVIIVGRFYSLVYNFDYFEVGVMFFNRVNPIGPCFCFRG